MNLPLVLLTIMQKLGPKDLRPWSWITEQPTDETVSFDDASVPSLDFDSLDAKSPGCENEPDYMFSVSPSERYLLVSKTGIGNVLDTQNTFDVISQKVVINVK